MVLRVNFQAITQSGTVSETPKDIGVASGAIAAIFRFSGSVALSSNLSIGIKFLVIAF